MKKGYSIYDTRTGKLAATGFKTARDAKAWYEGDETAGNGAYRPLDAVVEDTNGNIAHYLARQDTI